MGVRKEFDLAKPMDVSNNTILVKNNMYLIEVTIDPGVISIFTLTLFQRPEKGAKDKTLTRLNSIEILGTLIPLNLGLVPSLTKWGVGDLVQEVMQALQTLAARQNESPNEGDK